MNDKYFRGEPRPKPTGETLIVAGTGHRPENCEPETQVRNKARVKLQYPNKSGKTVGVFISGMAPGYDLWAADEARLLGIEVIAARPWAGHTPRKQDAELYEQIIEYASTVVNVDESQTLAGPWIYQKRNEWMVDNAQAVMAYWNSYESGGTWNCIQYARKVKKPIANIYSDPPF